MSGREARFLRKPASPDVFLYKNKKNILSFYFLFVEIHYICGNEYLTNNSDMEKQVIMNSENVREAYEAPKCEMIEMESEGTVLALSAGHDGFTEEDYGNVWGR